MNSTTATLVAAARDAAGALDAEAFAAASLRPGTIVVDVRETDERIAAGTIDGALHIPRGMLEFRADPSSPLHDPRLRKDALVLVHCADGDRSALAAATLRELGYRDVAHLAGGMDAWVAAGWPVFRPFRQPY